MVDLFCEEVLATDPNTSPDYGYNSTVSRLPPEMPFVCKAYLDPVLLEDGRVFRNMLNTEEFYISDNNYFENVQKEIKPHMRKLVTDWMLEVCLDQNCHADVFLLSCNVMDRFLSQVNIKKNQFQLVAASTMFIASKLVDPCPITGLDLVKYSDNTYQLSELLEMELVILSRLKWDLSTVTPYDFLEHLLKMVMENNGTLLETDQMKSIRNDAEKLIILCATEFRFSMYPPSMLSSAALAHSAQELEKRSLCRQLNVNQLISRLQILTRVENDCLNDCIYQIERTKEEASLCQEGEEVREVQTKEIVPHHQPPSPPDSPELKSLTPTEVFSVDLIEQYRS